MAQAVVATVVVVAITVGTFSGTAVPVAFTG